MKITWYSNAPWGATGYGTQSALFAERIAADGHDLVFLANWGHNGSPIRWGDIPVFGAGLDAYSNDVAPAVHARHMAGGKGWLFTLYDAWPLKFSDVENIASWMPVDHMTVPPDVTAWASRIRMPVAMSRFGQEAFRKAGVDARYVPHGIDTTVFRPDAILGTQGIPWRQAADIPPGAFVVGIVGANIGFPSRKAFGEMYAAMALLIDRHPDVYLYVHSDAVGRGGIDLEALQANLGIPKGRVAYVDQLANRGGMIPDVDLAGIYAGLDVLLSTSYGEGFGIPVVEAQACGTPVIVTDATAQPELCGAGWKVSGQPWYNAAQRSWWVIPNITLIVEALEAAYEARGDAGMRAAAREFALGYDIGRVYPEFMRPVLAEMEDMLASKPVNLAIRPARKRSRK